MPTKASIIDYPRMDLDKSIWNLDEDEITLQPDIRDEIEDIVASFVDDMHLPSDALIDVLIYGSILTNQYNSRTDVDARILLDPEKIKGIYDNISGEELYEAAEEIIHGITLGDTLHKFNATIVIKGEQTELGKSELGTTERDPVYSLKKDRITQSGKWYHEEFDPDKEFSTERDETNEIMEKLDKLIQETRSHTIDFELIKEAVSEVKNPDALIEKLEKKLTSIEDSMQELVQEYEQLKQDRSESYKNAPKNDRHRAPGNVRYKILEKYKYIDLLKKIKKIFEKGISPENVEDITETLQVSSHKRIAFPYKQQGPPEIEEAAPVTTAIPYPTEENPEQHDQGGGSFMHGGSCPYCGHQNTMNAKETGKEITCANCGKKFANADQPFALNTTPSIEQYTRPYESDVPVYATAQAQVNTDEVKTIIDMLKNLGIGEATIKGIEQRITKSEGTVTYPEEAGTPPEPEQPTEAPEQASPSKLTDLSLDTLTPNKVMKSLVKGSSESVNHEYKDPNKDLYVKHVFIPDEGLFKNYWYNSKALLAITGHKTLRRALNESTKAFKSEKVVADGSLDQFIKSNSWLITSANLYKIERGGVTMADLKKASLFDDGTPGKNPGDDPYSSGGKSLAEYGKAEKCECCRSKMEEDVPGDEEELMSILMVLDGIDILPYLKDDELIEELLETFPVMGNPNPKVDKLLEKAYAKMGLNQEPPEGTGQYIAPQGNPDYEETPKAQIEAKLNVESAEKIGEKIGIDWSDSDFGPDQLLAGIKVELEHGKIDEETNITDDNIETTAKIAWAHLKELPDYYTKLQEMEKEADLNINSAAYMQLCPRCRTIRRTDYWESTECPLCKMVIPGYFWMHVEEEMPKIEEEDIPSKWKEWFDIAKDKVEPEKERLELHEKHAQKTKLDGKTKSKINAELSDAGLDGNGRFNKPAIGLNKVIEILEKYGIAIYGSYNDYLLTSQPEGRIFIEIGFITDADHDPTKIDNAGLVFQQYKHESIDQYECLSYVT